jgi:hypothetical protein
MSAQSNHPRADRKSDEKRLTKRLKTGKGQEKEEQRSMATNNHTGATYI